MKTKLICALLLTMLLYNTTSIAADLPTSNCVKNEDIFYSCSTGKKYISFCASPKGTQPAYLEYRFGKPGKIELSYKVTSDSPSTKFNRAEILGANNASTEIWFNNNGIDYILGDPVKGDVTLEIVRNEKPIAKLVCKKEFIGDTNAKSNLIEQRTKEDYFKLIGVQ